MKKFIGIIIVAMLFSICFGQIGTSEPISDDKYFENAFIRLNGRFDVISESLFVYSTVSFFFPIDGYFDNVSFAIDKLLFTSYSFSVQNETISIGGGGNGGDISFEMKGAQGYFFVGHIFARHNNVYGDFIIPKSVFAICSAEKLWINTTDPFY